MSTENETVEPSDTNGQETTTTEPETGGQDDTPAAETDQQEKQNEDRSTPARSRSGAKSRRQKVTTDDVVAYFAPCGRCGFFLSGYRAEVGQESLETAVAQAKGGWLTFAWSYELQELLLKSYGSRIEANDYHFDGCCPECRRAFTYHASRSDKHPDRLRIEIKPRRRQ